MIFFNYETDFVLENTNHVSKWIQECLLDIKKEEGEINYIFCEDDYLHELNVKYLKHNTLTDIISFDYSMGGVISGDIFISIERVKENALQFETTFEDELHRVMVHGVLHFCGYNDATKEEKDVMRTREDYYLSLRTF